MKSEDVEANPALGESTRGAGGAPAGDAGQATAAGSDGRLLEDLRKIASQGTDTVDALQGALDAARALLSAEAAPPPPPDAEPDGVAAARYEREP